MSDSDNTPFEKLDSVTDHKDRAMRLKQEATDEIEHQLREELPFDAAIEVHPEEESSSFTTIVQPRLESFDPGVFGDNAGAYFSQPLRLVISSDGSTDGVESMQDMVSIVKEIQEDHEVGAPIEKVIQRAEVLGMSRSKAESRLSDMKKRGDIYEPQNGFVRAI